MDERAYGACLHDNEYLIPRQKRSRRRVDAARKRNLKPICVTHGLRTMVGELPPGVAWKNGSRPVYVRLQRGFVNKIFHHGNHGKVFGMLSASPEEQ